MAAKVAATKSSSSDTPPAIRRQRQSSETGLGLGKGRLRNAILNRFRSSTVTGSSSKVTSGEELESRIENANKGSPISNDPSSTGTPNQSPAKNTGDGKPIIEDGAAVKEQQEQQQGNQQQPNLEHENNVSHNANESGNNICSSNGESASANIPDLEAEGARVFKKVSTSGKVVLYLINRDLVISKDSVSTLHAVITVDAEELRNRKVFAQILLTFRYGRDDEEVMGLKLSNESVLCVEQICPLLPGTPTPRPLNKCQEVLMQRLGPQAHIVNLKLHHAVPASVRLLPAKEYNGAAIGISYDLRVYIAESIEEKPQRKNQVRMAIRLVQYAPLELQQMTDSPLVKTDRHFLLREGNLQVEVGIDRHWYSQGTPIIVSVNIRNRSSRIVKKIQIRAIQFVDVTMFSNGKFKNTIAILEDCDGLPVGSGQSMERRYPLPLMDNGGGRHWVALEDRYGRLTTTLASTTLKSSPSERHFFAIYISYYVKVRLAVSGVGGDISIKIPFVLMRDGPEKMPPELEDTPGNSCLSGLATKANDQFNPTQPQPIPSASAQDEICDKNNGSDLHGNNQAEFEEDPIDVPSTQIDSQLVVDAQQPTESPSPAESGNEASTT